MDDVELGCINKVLYGYSGEKNFLEERRKCVLVGKKENSTKAMIDASRRCGGTCGKEVL